MGIGLGVAKEIGGLWADGIPIGAVLGGPLPTSSLLPVESSTPALASGPPPLDGPHGAVLRQAVADRRHIEDLLNRMSASERARLPDVRPTADALYERIAALAAALDRLEGQVDDDRGPALDARIEQIERQPGDPGDRERRLMLLRRQRQKLAELVQARRTLLEQYESAGLLLQNLGLDLLSARSSGLDSALSGITSATQEARALSREIGYVLSAAEELRDLDGQSERGA